MTKCIDEEIHEAHKFIMKFKKERDTEHPWTILCSQPYLSRSWNAHMTQNEAYKSTRCQTVVVWSGSEGQFYRGWRGFRRVGQDGPAGILLLLLWDFDFARTSPLAMRRRGPHLNTFYRRTFCTDHWGLRRLRACVCVCKEKDGSVHAQHHIPG